MAPVVTFTFGQLRCKGALSRAAFRDVAFGKLQSHSQRWQKLPRPGHKASPEVSKRDYQMRAVASSSNGTATLERTGGDLPSIEALACPCSERKELWLLQSSMLPCEWGFGLCYARESLSSLCSEESFRG